LLARIKLLYDKKQAQPDTKTEAMKKILLSFLSVLLLLVGSCKDEDIPQFSLNKPETPKLVEMQMMFSSEPDSTIPIKVFVIEEIGTYKIPNGGYLEGYSSVTGALSTSNSYFVLYNCSLDTYKNEITSGLNGTITSEEGDSFKYSGTIAINIINSTFSGTMSIHEGTGELSGIKGTVSIIGKIDLKTCKSYWTGSGEVEI